MHAVHRVQDLLNAQLTPMHAARKAALFAAVAALVRGGKLPLTSLGRSIAGAGAHKHGIKRVDRLLGNQALLAEQTLVYRALAHQTITAGQRPILLVDWSEAGAERCMLTAAVAFQGRAISIWTEAHPLSKLGNAAVETRFLKRLRDILPQGCRPIVVTDAGFRVPWFRKVLRLGWDYVGRLRGRLYLQPAQTPTWVPLKSLVPQTRRRPQDLGPWRIARSQAHLARLILFDGRSRRALRRARPHKGRAISAKQAAKSAREVWRLVTSLSTETATQVVRVYALRMQIEELLRDTKSHRFGWAFEDARPRRLERLGTLVLLATLATFAATLAGLAAEAAGLHRGYQANTIHTRRVLSLVTLGRLILADHPARGGLLRALATMRRQMPSTMSLA